MKYLKRGMEVRTRCCCKSLGWLVRRGERLIKARDSWFFAKNI